MLQPRACARPFFTFQNGSLRMRAEPRVGRAQAADTGGRADAVGQASAISTWATRLQRPPELFDRVLAVAHQCPLRDVEAGDLGLPAVEAGDRVGVDRAAEVGDQLTGRRGQLAQVVADGLDDRADGVHGDPAAEPADLVADEVRQVAEDLSLGHSSRAHGPLERLDDGLVALAAVVDQHERQIDRDPWRRR